MDIMLDETGDLVISQEGDILVKESVEQKIRIRLLWFEGEWKWDKEEGLPYLEELLIKNPNTDYFESLIREKIFEVDEVTEIEDVEVIYENKTRKCAIKFTAKTDFETVRKEVII